VEEEAGEDLSKKMNVGIAGKKDIGKMNAEKLQRDHEIEDLVHILLILPRAVDQEEDLLADTKEKEAIVQSQNRDLVAQEAILRKKAAKGEKIVHRRVVQVQKVNQAKANRNRRMTRKFQKKNPTEVEEER